MDRRPRLGKTRSTPRSAGRPGSRRPKRIGAAALEIFTRRARRGRRPRFVSRSVNRTGHAGEDLRGAVQLDGDVLHVPARDDPRDDERAEEERHEDVEAVVSRVRRRDGDDERHQDEAEPDVRDPDQDSGMEELLEARAERHGLQRGTGVSSRMRWIASRSRRPLPPPSQAPGCAARTRWASVGTATRLTSSGVA